MCTYIYNFSCLQVFPFHPGTRISLLSFCTGKGDCSLRYSFDRDSNLKRISRFYLNPSEKNIPYLRYVPWLLVAKYCWRNDWCFFQLTISKPNLWCQLVGESNTWKFTTVKILQNRLSTVRNLNPINSFDTKLPLFSNPCLEVTVRIKRDHDF